MAKPKEQVTPKATDEELAEKTRLAQAKFSGTDSDMEAKANDVDPFESMDTFTPGKEGFTEGVTYAGTFVRTKRVVNENSLAAKLDPVTGEKIRLLHIFRHKSGDNYGIWGVGSLDATMRNVRTGDWLKITYDGFGEPLKPGQNPPHAFIYKGVRADGTEMKFDWDSDSELPVTPPGQPVQARQ